MPRYPDALYARTPERSVTYSVGTGSAWRYSGEAQVQLETDVDPEGEALLSGQAAQAEAPADV